MSETGTAGWYEDPTDNTKLRYWTGTEWTGERVWNGQEWTDASVSGSPVPNASITMPSWSKTFWITSVGAAAVALGSFLPWAEVRGLLGSASVKPDGGAVVIFLTLAAGALWFAAPTKDGQTLSSGRRVGLVACVGLLAFFLFTNWSSMSDLHDENDAINMGAGLLVFGGGVITLIVGTVRAVMSKPSHSV